ncbi:MAG: bifunctional DNA-binding transcriptional regulator/O6-methylguanine-DNA methyltransferase Ada [Gammaproteobacteria bacterium]|nr:bifunctional DNA-binding transcriptional regulator/O6-methylguanine-DNA methyltransferase Ada [Gammaproteobacteria bacterium]MBU1504381.1 bifunctional DNA-binding transcriptional regulator/O6-methylguanine-DNA methyltransferase Ada [Gammaproteobacteria bacterium]MBU2119017.1 bifunctional DNA-binding transcriptional regulator/O6-methylguanine-DNA methyltransferase Ada [Gammaproteobacteria bacterium]MBU2171760.1 bifunctional DNA-binding transcriptional regulator/O6-methylguanine-DNA methyltrans
MTPNAFSTDSSANRLIPNAIPMPHRASPSSKAQQAAATQADPRWAAVLARSAAAEGSFWYSVQTTGVYCRPSCAARTPRPENVRFHASCADAEAAGFRPCQRCKPRQPTALSHHAALVTEACRSIESAESDKAVTLDTLAAGAGLSASHFHRIFKQATGLTPKAYAAAHRAQRLRNALNGSPTATVTDAIYSAGYPSSSRFYEQSAQVLGMTPSRYRAGGTALDIRFAIGQCSLGAILVAQSERGICAILLGDDADALVRDLQDRFAQAHLIGGDAAFEALVAQVVAFVEAPGLGLNLPLDVRGTAFQQRVWQALQAIPAGQMASYAEVAARIGAPTAVRAVAQACAANALAVAIPCHRVVKSDGALSGYRWGVERKRKLLDLESLPSSPSDHASASATVENAA